MAGKPVHREMARETAANNLQLRTRKSEMMKARNEGTLSVLHDSFDDQGGGVEVE
jgi:hypothetical protein